MRVVLRRSHWGLMCFASVLMACAETSQMQGQVAGLKNVVKQAQDNGAKYCAPRELALAESHLQFAQIELEQGYASKAQRHLWIAEPNANAAVFLSPPENVPTPATVTATATLIRSINAPTSQRITTALRTATAARMIRTPTWTAFLIQSINACSIPKTRTGIWMMTAAGSRQRRGRDRG